MVDELKEQIATPDAERSPNIYAMLAARARSATDGRLVLDAAVGTIALGATVFVHIGWWSLLLPLVSLGALGFWGIADRELATPGLTPESGRHRALGLAKWTAIVVGTVAAVAGAAIFMGVALGTIIS